MLAKCNAHTHVCALRLHVHTRAPFADTQRFYPHAHHLLHPHARLHALCTYFTRASLSLPSLSHRYRTHTHTYTHIHTHALAHAYAYAPSAAGGFNDEDTLNSWKYLIPKAPRVDLAKIRTATGKSLRYEAKLVTTDPVNASREFRITYFLDDSDVSVYEPPLRNSGCLSGIFQKRAKCINPLTGAAYKMSDFAIGSRVVVKGHAFTITALDEASRRAAESSPIKDTGDIIKILATLKSKLGDSSLSLRKMFRKFDKDCSQVGGRVGRADECMPVCRVCTPVSSAETP